MSVARTAKNSAVMMGHAARRFPPPWSVEEIGRTSCLASSNIWRWRLIVAKWVFGIGRLALLSVVLVPAITSQTQAAAPQAVRAACSGDAQRLCAAVLGDSKKRQACMREHRAELSAGCKAAIAQWRGKGAGAPQGGQLGSEDTKLPPGRNRLERCRAYVQAYSFTGNINRLHAGPAAVRRCMHGEEIGF
jgi:hypothetical protein